MIDQKSNNAIERIIVNVQVGDTFKVQGHKYKVDTVYPHYALCIRDDGINECFTIGDFVMMGKEPVDPTNENCIELV